MANLLTPTLAIAPKEHRSKKSELWTEGENGERERRAEDIGIFPFWGKKVGFKHSVTLRSAALDWREDGWRQHKKEEKRYKCNAWMRKKEGEGKGAFEGILANVSGTYGGFLYVKTIFLNFCWMVKPTCKISYMYIQ